MASLIKWGNPSEINLEDLVHAYLEYRQTTTDTSDFLSILSKMATEVPYLSGPLTVGLNITKSCNQNCQYCFIKASTVPKQGPTLTFGDWIRIIDELDEMKVIDIYITGGEPFLVGYILDLVRYMKTKKNFLRIGIQSNGTLINDAKARELSLLFDDDSDYVQISLDTTSSEDYRKLRGRDDFDRVIQAIKILKKYGLKVKINAVYTRYNVNKLPDLYKFLHELGVDLVSFMPLFPVKNSLHLAINNYEILLKNFYSVLELSKTLGSPKIVDDPIPTFPLAIKIIEENIPKKIAKKLFFFCPAGRTAIEIDAYGNVYPCPFLQNPEFVAGNLRYASLKSIWNEGKGWEKFRYGRDLAGTKCEKCIYLDQCKGACAASAFHVYGDINMPDSRCEMYEG